MKLVVYDEFFAMSRSLPARRRRGVGAWWNKLSHNPPPSLGPPEGEGGGGDLELLCMQSSEHANPRDPDCL